MKNEEIRNKIYKIRGKAVMLDRDLAGLYSVSTGNLNKAVNRNIERFPEDFMFQLTKEELQNWIFQFGTSNREKMGIRKLPYAFTEHGVVALSGILRSSTAADVNVQIVRAFVAMRKFIRNNAGIFQRLDKAEAKLLEHDKKFQQVFNAIEDKQVAPSKGIFFEGQVLEAHRFVSDLIRSAKQSIILIDNYVDDSVLALLSKRKKNVEAIVYTRLTKQFKLDIEKHNSGNDNIKAVETTSFHDRFLIIDDTIYHFGHSLKDLGRKVFGFSKFGKDSFSLLEKLNSD